MQTGDMQAEGHQALVHSYTLSGIEALPVEVQVSVDQGYPMTNIVGLPNQAVQESMDRIRAAFHSTDIKDFDKRVTVNLAPAELRKEGSSFDLPIALGILAAMGWIPPDSVARYPVAGELALSGEVRPIRGALAMALSAAKNGDSRLLLPAANVAEASEVAGVTPKPLLSLADAIDRLRNDDWRCPAPPSTDRGDDEADSSPTVDFAQVRGQAAARRALEVTAAGGHNLLMIGPPGAGKTLLAQRLATILPALNTEEALETTLVHSVAGLLRPGVARIRQRPFRAPHHTVSGPGLVGGGAVPRPGEISLAHRGVLFLDEMPEFRPQVLNLLRQPLEDGWVRIVRLGRTVTFPSRFVLVGAMNPCPCGFLGHPRKPCRCTPHQIQRYRGRLGGPLLDRIDLRIDVPAVSARELIRENVPAARNEECSASIRARVEAARDRQRRRFEGRPGIHCNAQMGITEVEEFCRIDAPMRAFLQRAMESLSLSARATHRALRVARTIADLAGAEELRLEHVAEAVQYQADSEGPPD